MELSDITSSTKNYPIAWISGGLSLLLGLYFYFTFSSLSDYEQRLDDVEHEVSVLKSNFREGNDLEYDLDELKKGFVTVNERLIDRNQIANNNGFFYSLGQSHPVEILDVSQRTVIREKEKILPGEIWALKHFAVVPFEMKVVGLLTDIIDFLYTLDESERFIEVRSFRLNLSEKMEAGYMMMNLEINILATPSTVSKENPS